MFSPEFSHYLSYGATDQRTVRELTGEYTGLLIPGTVAAFQREGTGGFVLTLSATASAPEYAIDPRFPLFQQPLHRPKRSHVALAELLGAPELVRSAAPVPADFSPELVATVGSSWARFNGDYQAHAGSKFAKYARRLKQEVQPKDAHGPRYVLPPYTVAADPSDDWWRLSGDLYDATRAALDDPSRSVRVIAAQNAVGLGQLIPATMDKHFAVWVSGLEELASPAHTLAAYGRAIATAHQEGRQPFALYGGFFSVLLSSVGLSGASHGVGYGEYRNWIELPESGPPPARYYLPQLHRYLQPDEAARLYFADRRLAECRCAECDGEPPLGLDYHALMKHSVRCRADEIRSWQGLDAMSAANRLEEESNEYQEILLASGLPDVAIARTGRQAQHIAVWIDALRAI